ncbi:AzlC family ABC transporter permease [Salinisphaera aquimarina]|uniref:AzlC family ABC transporter permease n=1 Tax=Salinisphaera aquimarina TaxID=2094031 RepID=A0ABV7EMR8_9GAMM
MSQTPLRRLYPDFAAGTKAVLPLLISVLPFAAIVGVVAVRLGLSPFMASVFSVFVFAGSSQIAAMQLMHDGAPLLVILVTVFFINLRFTMYSASIAPHFRGARRRTRALIGYLLTDQSYIVGLYGFAERDRRDQRVAFVLGAALPFWCGWQITLAAGALLGARLPADWGLDFAVPLTFLALLLPAIVDRATLAAALIAGIVAVFGHDLPWNMGLIVGAIAGIMAGVGVATVRDRRGQDT